MNEAIRRKPDVSYFSDLNKVVKTSIDGSIDFTIQNVGSQKIFFGFTKDSKPDIPLDAGDFSSFPLYRSCEEWTGDLFLMFGTSGGAVMVIKTI
ncbi:MAG TPA: hypothetical protein PLJ60_18260 [Chryseolinea sp.]|nr:hypothetical protein [Chryseolinea sp.]HPM32283.1 hypothetical protein [Chryseolinea sp.]